MTRLAVLVGLASEAGLLRRAASARAASFQIAVSGADAARAHWEAGHLAHGRPGLLVSFGLAGGLDPALAPGALVVADAVIAPDGGRLACDAPWRRRLRDALPDAHGGTVLGVDAAAASAAEKRLLHKTCGAAIVDMESHAAARAAHDCGVPLVVLRAVCDPAGRGIPESFLDLADADGRLRWRPALTAMSRRPGTAVRLWRDSRKAHAALREAATALVRLCAGPETGC